MIIIKVKNVLKLLICVFIPLLVGSISGIFTSQSIATWYIYLNKPRFNPPNYLFGPVWSILYLLMGISLFLVLKNGKYKYKFILIFALQLLLNFFWSIIFFKFQCIGWALVEISLMWISIFLMILIFYRSNKIAGLMNIPYLFWVSFATVLNYYIYILN